jgi:hypothetical protein
MTARHGHYPPFISMDVPIFHPSYWGAFPKLFTDSTDIDESNAQ